MITARGLSRRFKTKSGPVDAVKGIDLDVAKGEIVGLLGPNGAGKTTTLRMLTTLLAPSGGTASVAGHDLLKDPRNVRRSIGYVAQVGSAPSAGTLVGEELITQARLQGLSKTDAVRRLAELAPSLQLAGLEGRALLELSGGQRRRFDIGLGLMHSPSLVFLDEPTAGLDPQSRANLWEHIRDLRDSFGLTVVLTTHYLEEADALADRILVMDHGEIIANDTSDALKARISGDVIAVGLVNQDDGPRAVEVARAAIDVRGWFSYAPTLDLTVERGDVALAPLVRAFDAAGIAITSLDVKRPTLDDVFLTLTGRAEREAAAAPAPH
ncbi:ATP-binding cassette domain-containing protein [Acidothermaceae bacterium B102]|nr:ATP-binding cassette domain-containing protein [Acidothermaceae bacterium B102]